MRIDKFLKVSRILKRRAVANTACELNRVFVNGKAAKAGLQIKIGDIVKIEFGNSTMVFKIVKIDEKANKESAQTLYEIIGEN